MTVARNPGGVSTRLCNGALSAHRSDPGDVVRLPPCGLRSAACHPSLRDQTYDPEHVLFKATRWKRTPPGPNAKGHITSLVAPSTAHRVARSRSTDSHSFWMP
jgi:hypothetical protein